MPEAVDDKAREFFLKEYDALQARMVFARTDMVRMETIAPFAVGGIIAWVLTHPEIQGGYRVAIFAVPFIITLVVGLRYLSRHKMVVRTETYLREIETILCEGAPLHGYERFVKDLSDKQTFSLLKASRYLMWGTMVLITGGLLGESFARL